MAVERQPKVVVNTTQELVEIFDVLKVSSLAARDARFWRTLKHFARNWQWTKSTFKYCRVAVPDISEITKVLGHVLFTTRLDTERTHNKPNTHTLLIHVKFKLYLEYLSPKTPQKDFI